MTTMIERIWDSQSLKPTWKSLFVSDDPFGWPFHPEIETRILFYPTEGYHLSEDQYRAVIEAARAVGDDGFFISIIEGQGDIMQRGAHWWCEFPSYRDYLDLPLVLENTIYSKNSRWGMMVSHEDHAVIGGCSGFVDRLRQEYPSWQNDWNELKETWVGNPNSLWLDLMQECPCCKGYGDVWSVEFLNLDRLKAIMCFECDTVWGFQDESLPEITDYESLTKNKGVAADWSQINKLGQITTTE